MKNDVSIRKMDDKVSAIHKRIKKLEEKLNFLGYIICCQMLTSNGKKIEFIFPFQQSFFLFFIVSFS